MNNVEELTPDAVAQAPTDPGTYILTGAAYATGHRRVYVGKAAGRAGLRGRLAAHRKNKLWWDKARFVAVRDADADAVAKEAERRLRDDLWHLEFPLLGNGNSPQPGGAPRGHEVAEALLDSLRDDIDLSTPRTTEWGARASRVLDRAIEGHDVARTRQGNSVVYRPRPHRRVGPYDLGVWLKPPRDSTDRNAVEFSMHLVEPVRDAFAALLRERFLLEQVGRGDWPMTPMEWGAIEPDELSHVLHWYFQAATDCAHRCQRCDFAGGR